MADDSHEQLVEQLRRAPGLEWVEAYFDLVATLVDATALSNDDPRLVMSLPAKGTLPVTVNNRYVLVGFRGGDDRTEFIFPADRTGVEQYRERADRDGRFRAIYDEPEHRRPRFLAFDGQPDRAVDLVFAHLWLTAVERELDRAEASPYRRYHEPVVYRAATDREYRERVLREAFR